MKRCFVIFVIVLVSVGAIVTVILLNSNKEPGTELQTFSLSEFEYELGVEYFVYSKNVGTVESAEDAIRVAIELLKERDMLDDPLPLDYSKAENLEVSLDDAEQCWHIKGKLNFKYFGGVPHVLVRKSGEVLAVWVDD